MSKRCAARSRTVPTEKREKVTKRKIHSGAPRENMGKDLESKHLNSASLSPNSSIVLIYMNLSRNGYA